MTQISLPYTLRDGQKAYAARLMANFDAIANQLNHIRLVGGENESQDLQGILQQLLDLARAAIPSYAAGTASQVCFSDGQSLQEKMDEGQLRGQDGVSLQLNGLYSFFVDPDSGHLLLLAPSGTEQPPFSIDGQGRLTYTLPDPEQEETGFTSFDLGQVRGEQGLAGEMSENTYDPRHLRQDIFAYAAAQAAAAGSSHNFSCVLNAAAWDQGQAAVSCTGLGAQQHFICGCSPEASPEQRQAWRQGRLFFVSQSVNQFTLGADGSAPAVNIPLSVITLP